MNNPSPDISTYVLDALVQHELDNDINIMIHAYKVTIQAYNIGYDYQRFLEDFLTDIRVNLELNFVNIYSYFPKIENKEAINLAKNIIKEIGLTDYIINVNQDILFIDRNLYIGEPDLGYIIANTSHHMVHNFLLKKLWARCIL